MESDRNLKPEQQSLTAACASGSDGFEASYGMRIERRRPALARSAYAGILAAVFAFTMAVTLAAGPATEASTALGSEPISSRVGGQPVGLIEAPSLSANTPSSSSLGSSEPAQDSAQTPVAAGSPSEELLSTPADENAPESDFAAQSDTSDASTLSETDQRGQEALALISYPWAERLPDWTITFHPPKSGLYGLTLVSEKRIEIYLRDGESQTLLAHVVAHELGHAVDVTHNDGPDRRSWSEARNLGSAQWWPGDGATDFSTGAGDFAEAFAAWQVGQENFRSNLAGPPTQEQIALLAALSY